MQKTVYFCDLCCKEISTEDDGIVSGSFNVTDNDVSILVTAKKEGVPITDICLGCLVEILTKEQVRQD